MYELKVILVFLMAHPKVEAASLIQQFFVTNPIIMIQLIDIRNRLRYSLDQEWLTEIKKFKLEDYLKTK